MKKKFLAVSLMISASIPAFAQTGFYGGLEYGQSRTSKSGSESVREEFGRVDLDSPDPLTDYGVFSAEIKRARSANASRIFIGYGVNENIQVEVGYKASSNYVISGDYSFEEYSYDDASQTAPGPNDPRNVMVDPINGSVNGAFNYSGVDFSALFRPSKTSGLNNFFVRWGVHSFSGKGSVTSLGVTESLNESGYGPLLGIGYDFPINEKIDLRASATRYNKIAGLSDINVNYFTLGLKMNF